MKTVGVTFGDGPFEEIAARLADRFSKVNGIPAYAIPVADAPPMHSGNWMKAFLWDWLPEDVERFVWFDSDVVPIASMMEFMPHPGVAFAGCEDVYAGGRQGAEWICPEVEGLDRFVNTGVFVATREFEPVLVAAREMMNQTEWTQRDQIPINLKLPEHLPASKVGALPPICNWMFGFGTNPPRDIRMLHLAGLKDEGLRFALLHSYLLCFEPERAEEFSTRRSRGLCLTGRDGVGCGR